MDHGIVLNLSGIVFLLVVFLLVGFGDWLARVIPVPPVVLYVGSAILALTAIFSALLLYSFTHG